MSARRDIPVSVFTGFLGAGKTTIILSLLKQLPKDYKVVLLKNEFGDVEVDSQLAKESAVESVSEILNGCMCCVLVGQMRTALLEIKEKFAPDRIIIESSGSAFPATLAWQVRQLEDEGLKLDAVLTVIDCLNFKGYEDTSPTAKMQAKYTDLLLLNKHELASERQLDDVLDSLYELNTETPKIKVSRTQPVNPDLVFGLLTLPNGASHVNGTAAGQAKESQVFRDIDREKLEKDERLLLPDGSKYETHNDEVETKSIWRGGKQPGQHEHDHDHGHAHEHSHANDVGGESQVDGTLMLSRARLEEILNGLVDAEEVLYRIKGFLLLQGSESNSRVYYILNWAFGRYELHQASQAMSERLEGEGVEIRLTVMGARGELSSRAKKLAGALSATVS